jgi:3-hydroxyacyl-[acyl-carrier-protein] dehydratase
LPPALLFDLSGINLQTVRLTRSQIYELLPLRHEFMLLDGVCSADLETLQIVGFADIRPDAWWCRGHVPESPILPGVLMLEMGAQLSAVLAKISGKYPGFIGFGGVEQCKFRARVVPPCRLLLVSKGVDYRSRRIVSDVQGLVNDTIIFEARVSGLVM